MKSWSQGAPARGLKKNQRIFNSKTDTRAHVAGYINHSFYFIMVYFLQID